MAEKTEDALIEHVAIAMREVYAKDQRRCCFAGAGAVQKIPRQGCVAQLRSCRHRGHARI
ncbi:hypothetical protein [Mesorhizobium sp. M0643]|uniref:hypothetical protein n=1 Tax=Mesorhizobium sp. M0643 TaxID=2956978 RepID=UPI0033381B4B